MAETIAVLKFKRGTTTEWASANPILSMGEGGFDTDLKRLKIGDGITPWASLGWSVMAPAEVESVLSAASTIATGVDATDGALATALETPGSASGTVLSAKIGEVATGGAVMLRDYLSTGATPADNRAAYLAAYQAAAAGPRRLCYDGARFTMAGEPVVSTATDMVHFATNRDSTKIIQSTKGKPALVLAGERSTVESIHIDADNPTLDGIVGIGSSFRNVGIWIDPTAHDSVIRNVRVGGFFYGVRAHLYPWSELANASADAATVATAGTAPTAAAYPSLRNLTIDGLQSDVSWAAFHCISVDGLTISGVTGKYMQAPGSTADPHLVYVNSIYSSDEVTIYRPTKRLIISDCQATSGTNRHAYRFRGVQGLNYSRLVADTCPGLYQFISCTGLTGGDGCESRNDKLPYTDGSGSMSFLYCEGDIDRGTVTWDPTVEPGRGWSVDGCSIRWNRPRVVTTSSVDSSATRDGACLGELLGPNAGTVITEPEFINQGTGLVSSALRFTTSGQTTGDNQAQVVHPRVRGNCAKYGIWGGNVGVKVRYNPDEIEATTQKVRMHTSTTSLPMVGVSEYAPERYDLDPTVIAWNLGEALQANDTSPGRRWGGGLYGYPMINTWVGDGKGRMWITGAGDYALTCVNTSVLHGTIDVDIRVSVKRATADRVGIALRGVDDANTLAFVQKSSTEVQLIKRVSNGTTVLATATIAFPTTLFAQLRVLAVGNRIIGFFNGVQVVDYTLTGDPATAGTDTNLFANASTSVRAGIYGNSGTLTSAIWERPVIRKVT